MLNIRLTAEEMDQVKALLSESAGGGYSNKITAIKVVRDASMHQKIDEFTGKPRAGVGLKEAKEAVELLMADLGMKTPDGTPALRPSDPSARIVPFQPIKKIVCDFGAGEVELDLEGMSLKVLTGLNGSIPLADVMALIDLYQRVKDWEDSLAGLCKPARGVV